MISWKFLGCFSCGSRKQGCTAHPLPGGDVVPAWASIHQGGSGRDVFARVLKMAEGCPGDLDGDSDVEGLDLGEHVDDPAAVDTADLAVDFGCTDCHG